MKWNDISVNPPIVILNIAQDDILVYKRFLPNLGAIKSLKQSVIQSVSEDELLRTCPKNLGDTK